MTTNNGFHQPDGAEPPDDGDGDGSGEAGKSGGDLYGALSVKQQKAILALITEPTIAKAAAASEIGERTIYTWLDQDHFSRTYRKARRESFAQAIGLCQRYTPLAVNTLAQLLADHAVSSSARVAACTTLLKFGRESIELDDLAARVEVLEKAAVEARHDSRRAWSS